jgi:hypothetical protein
MPDEPRDVTVVLTEDHRQVETLLADLRALAGAASDEDRERAGELFEHLTMALVRHCVAEATQVAAPLRARVGGPAADLVVAAHAEIEEALERLQGVPATDPAFVPGLDGLAAALGRHVAAQQDGLPEQLSTVFTGEQLARLAGRVRAVRDVQLVEMVDDAAVPLPGDKLLGSVSEIFHRVRAAATDPGTGL